MNSELIFKLRQWDGVHIEYLKELYKLHSSNVDFFENLVLICTLEQDLQKTATWLIKHHYENRQKLTKHNSENLLNCCIAFENWEAKLHILQLLPFFTISNNSYIVLEEFIRKCLIDKNKFVKAWAFSGLYELTKYNPLLKPELELICQNAMESETGAIKSRVKKILISLSK